MKRKSVWLYLSVVSLCGLPCMLAQQQREGSIELKTVPRLMKFNGAVKDAGGNPLIGVMGITFSLYEEEYGREPLWHEVQNVELDANGQYTVLLGASLREGLPAKMFMANEARWLGIEPVGQAEQPRVLLLSVPYALKAADAETLGGRPASAFALATAESEVSSSAIGEAAARHADGSPRNADASLASVSGSGTATFIPLWTGTSGKSSTTLGNSALFQTGTGSAAKVGLSTITPAAPLDVEANTSTSATIIKNLGTGAGLSASTGSTSPVAAVVGQALATTGSSASGVLGKNSSSSLAATGVRGEIDASTGSGTGVLGITSGSGAGAAGVQGQATALSGLTYGGEFTTFSSSNNAAGVAAAADATTGLTYGLIASNASSGRNSAAISANSGAVSGETFGVIAFTGSPNGTATLSLAQGGSSTGNGIRGCCPVGVWGDTGSHAAGAAGLVGTADDARGLLAQNNSPSGVPSAFAFNTETTKANLPVLVAAGNVGGVFRSCTIDTNGNLACTGSKSAVVPVDNGQRHVALYAVEAPQNWFEDFGSGKLTNGDATIPLDLAFAQTVNTADYHVFLTPRADCDGLYVANSTNTGFEVRELHSGRSNVTFDYRIVALRRGYENVRLEDMTERMNNVRPPQPKATPVPPLALSAPPVRSAISGNDTNIVAGIAKAK